MKRVFYCILYTVLVLFFVGCQEEPGTLDVPADGSDKQYTLAFTDTSTLITSTVLLDSVPTSDNGVVLVGKYNDNKLGAVEARAYFELINESRWNLTEDDEYDSAVLLMDYTGYYYGDITKTQTLQVREVSKEFTSYTMSKYWVDMGVYSYFSKDANKIYNTSNLQVKNDPIGESSFIPRPTQDSIRIKIKDTLGEKWFNLGRKDSIKNPGDFLKYFKGIAINGTTESSILGIGTYLTGGSSGVRRSLIRVYYHETLNNTLVKKTFDFSFPDSKSYKLHSFSKIEADRTGTSIAALTNQNEIPASQTDQETYIQSGIGIVTKLTFPSLKKLVNLPGFVRINNARLILEPIRNSFDTHNLTPALTLFYSSRNKLPLFLLPNDFVTSSYQRSSIQVDRDSKNTSGYSFPITQFVQNVLSNKVAISSLDNVLLLSTDVADMGTSVNRTVLGGGERTNFRARIEIYYLKKN